MSIDVFAPGSEGYVSATSPHNSSAIQNPAYVAAPKNVDQTAAIVRRAQQEGLRVLPQSTGHGAAGIIGDDTVIVDTSGLSDVAIDAGAGVARAGAAATWSQVNAAAGRHGLIGLSGSAPDVAISGYTFGGGIGFLTRPHGMASSALRAVQFVDGHGDTRRATEDAADPADRDALWAFRGGGGVGIATALEFDLVSGGDLWAGYLLWPIDHLDAVVAAWGGAVPMFGTSLSTSIAVLHATAGPPFPSELQGKPLVHLALASNAGPEHAAGLFAALDGITSAAVNTWDSADAIALAQIHLDPPVAVPALGVARWLGTQTPQLAADLLRAAAAPDSPVAMAEIRHTANDAFTRPGAMTTVPGPFLLHAVGMARSRDARQRTEQALKVVAEAASAADLGRSVASFAEGRTSAPDGLHSADRARLAAIRDQIDPDHRIHATRFLASPQPEGDPR